MYELDFEPARFARRTPSPGCGGCGCQRCRDRAHELDDSEEQELSASDRLDLARAVVIALIRGAGERDATRLTNTAFHIHHPDRDLQKRIDPATEPALAAEWKTLKSSIVMPALGSSTSGTTGAAVTGSILLIGDSHTYGTFGQELERLLESAGALVQREAESGSDVKDWLPRVPALLRKHAPSTVIIALGANMRGFPSATATSKQIRTLVDLVRRDAPAARLIWIGPPRQREDTEADLQRFNQIIRNGLDRDAVFVDSAPSTPKYVGSDGTHYAGAAAKQWARGVFDQLR